MTIAVRFVFLGALFLIALPVIIHPIDETTLKVVGPLKVSEPVMHSANTDGLEWRISK